MTDQHHALRLLDSICYKEDRFTPFIMTSPLNGMAHGHYLNYDEKSGREFITDLCDSYNTAYTEFGSPSGAEVNFIKKYISEKDYKDLNCNNEVWREHHAFSAWVESSWLRIPEAEYYFGGFKDTEDLMNKTLFIQKMCYKSLFEEMRKQWPHCSMALNWCFNEPWPCFANNSLISYPNIPKPSYYAVKDALRPTLASLRVRKHLYKGGENFNAEVWILNDSLKSLESLETEVYYSLDDNKEIKLCSFTSAEIKPQQNINCGGISFIVPKGYSGKINISLKVKDHSEFNSCYTYLARSENGSNNEGKLNI
jgi:beta-mannosidase